MSTHLHSDKSGSTTTSPRISFSYDLSQSDAAAPVEQLLRSSSSSSFDFNFFVQEQSDLHHASMADELFSEGRILPTPMKLKIEKCERTRSLPVPVAGNDQAVGDRILPDSHIATEDEDIKQQRSKSFWGFKRSSSCDSRYTRSLCPIALLSRSYSTGSSTTSKPSLKDGFNQKHNRSFQKPSVSHKPPRRSGYGYGSQIKISSNSGIRVSPVLNLGFGSLFFKNNNRK